MKLTRNRKVAVGAVAVLAVAGGGAAIAANQLDSPSARSAAIVSDAAQQLGIQPDQLTAALQKAEEDQIDKEVAAGTLTKDQGDAAKAAIESGQVPLIGGGPGFGGPSGMGGRFGGPGPLGNLNAAATYLGVTVAALQSDLAGGKSLADVANDQGKTADGLISALVDATKADLDQAVTDGKLTSDQETQAEATLQQRVTDLVNGKEPAAGGGFRGGLGGGFRGGFGHGFGPGGGPGTLDTAATYLGVTTATLQTDLQGGKTLANVAKDQGRTVDGLVSALVDASKTRLEAAVKAGSITADQEAQFVQELTQRITDEVNGTRPSFGPRGGGFPGAPGGAPAGLAGPVSNA